MLSGSAPMMPPTMLDGALLLGKGLGEQGLCDQRHLRNAGYMHIMALPGLNAHWHTEGLAKSSNKEHSLSLDFSILLVTGPFFCMTFTNHSPQTTCNSEPTLGSLDISKVNRQQLMIERTQSLRRSTD